MLASVVLLTFNQERYVAAAVAGALAQTHRPLEIVICDDASTDRTFAVAEQAASQSPIGVSVRLHRNSINLGIAHNLSSAVAKTSGQIIVPMAGDDISEPNRVASLVGLFDTDTYAAGSQLRLIDGDGIVLQKCSAIPRPHSAAEAINTVLRGATAAYRREVFEIFSLMPAPVMNEDYVLPLRAALLGKIAFSDAPLIRYREHAHSFTTRSYHAGQQRYLASMNAVRHCQMADIKHARKCGIISTAECERLLSILAPLAAISAYELAVFWKRIRAINLALAARKNGVSWRDLVRSAVRLALPGVWRWHLAHRNRSSHVIT